MPYEPLEEKRVYRRAEELSDRVWEIVVTWDWFAKRVVGDQLARAADSIGANIAEAGGRYHPRDVRNFLYYSRGSLRETKYWLRRALKRGLMHVDVAVAIDQELEQLAREIMSASTFRSLEKPINHLTT